MVSVIMPVYNGELYLREAIESILNQTYTDFELICIDDGSSDGTLQILNEYSDIDQRIIIVSRENRGLISTLNEGLSLAKYNYIARMDADDISMPTRLEKQINYLRSHKEVGVIGSSYISVDQDRRVIGERRLWNVNYILKAICIFGSPFAHPSVMFNKLALGADLHYSSEYKHAEDYELWTRLEKITKFAALSEPLLEYRVLQTSISRRNYVEQKENMLAAACKNLLACQPKNKSSILKFYLDGQVNIDFILFIFMQKRLKNIAIQLCYLFVRVIKWKA